MRTCIIVDDEAPARELMQRHLSALKDFTLLKSFGNAMDAFDFLQRNKVDLMFLDIQMPGMSGLNLIRSLKVCPRIILTTAYREHAVEAFELDVMDYLVKPITQERFMMAVSKFNYYEEKSIPPVPGDGFNDAYLFLRIANEQTKIFLRDILYIEGLKDYVKIHTPSRVLVAGERISYLEQKLPELKFARIHKSFIVSLSMVTRYGPDQVTIANERLPVGRVYKNEFLKKLSVNG